jgi:hypothetical protein
MPPKYFLNIMNQLRSAKCLARKLKGMLATGRRIAPSRTSKNDQAYQLRLDSGELIGTKLNVYLQVNASAKEALFKEWIKKHGTHAKLATGVFDTAAKDEQIEKNRLLDDLTEKGGQALSEL